jgi:hypothetical protein
VRGRSVLVGKGMDNGGNFVKRKQRASELWRVLCDSI